MLARLGALVLVASGVLAAPAPAITPSFCSDVNFIVGLLKLQKATPFCSSFIHIPTVTATVTSVASTATSFLSTSTIIITQSTTVTNVVTSIVPATATSVETDVSSAYQTSTASSTHLFSTSSYITSTASTTSTTTITSTATSYAAYHLKRDVQVEERGVLPTYLAAFATSEVSKACSCLSIPTPTTTVTTVITTTTAALAKPSSTLSQTSTSVAVVFTTSVTTLQTTTVTTTTISTVVTTEIDTSSTNILTTTITETSIVTATAIATVTSTTDPCNANGYFYTDEAYIFAGIFHTGYDTSKSITNFGAIKASDCCTQCYNTPGCGVWITSEGQDCGILVVGSIGYGPSANSQCPAGYDFVDILSGRQSGLDRVLLDEYDAGPGPCFAGVLNS